MLTVTREVYYCEHCKRHRLSKSAIEKHEPRCIYNPERSACGWHPNGGTRPPSELVARFVETLDVDWLREEVEGCPACMLAVVVQARRARGSVPFFEFSYSDEVDRFRENERENHVLAF